MTEQQVEDLLTERHGLSVGSTFTDSDAPQALLDVRAKAILKQGPTAAMGQFDCTAEEVAEALTTDAVCDDLRTFLDYLEELA